MFNRRSIVPPSVGRRAAAAAAAVAVERLERRAMFTVTPDPGNTLATAFNIGDLNGQVTLQDTVGTTGTPDVNDVYRFTMPRDGMFFGRLRVDSDAADITLIAQQFDANGHEIDPNLLRQTASRLGPDSGFATGDLPGIFLKTGTYFLFLSSRGGKSPYLVRMTADYAGDTLATARDIGSATDATFQDFLGQESSPSLNDAVDVYKFKMDAAGDALLDYHLDEPAGNLARLELIHDINGNGVIDNGELLFKGVPSAAFRFRTRLLAGTYFLRMTSDLNFSNYHLLLTADYAGSAPATQRVIGPLDKGKSFKDFLSAFNESQDKLDQYSFSVTSPRTLHVVFIEADTGTAILSVLRDANHNGIVDAGDTPVFSTDDKSLFNELASIDAGDYLIQIAAESRSGTYQLFVEAPKDAAGSTLATAKNLGTINGLTHQEDFLSDQDPIDFFKFTTSAAGRISARLDIEVGEDAANLVLIRDANNNGRIDAGDVLAQSALPTGQIDQFSKSVPAGTYFLGIFFTAFQSTSKYVVSFHTDYAGGTPATARNVGALVGPRTFDDWASGPFGGVISDTVDVYKFSLAATKTLTAKLSASLSGQDLDLELYRDKNNDGKVTADERIAVSHHPDTAAEQITKALAAGTYFLRVVGVNGETNYHLALSA